MRVGIGSPQFRLSRTAPPPVGAGLTARTAQEDLTFGVSALSPACTPRHRLLNSPRFRCRCLSCRRLQSRPMLPRRLPPFPADVARWKRRSCRRDPSVIGARGTGPVVSGLTGGNALRAFVDHRIASDGACRRSHARRLTSAAGPAEFEDVSSTYGLQVQYSRHRLC